jgi:DNA replication and repair protein RecF
VCLLLFSSLILRNFRNYTSLQIDWSYGVNIICGLNAQGKSNLLEAVSYLSTGSSFRSGKDEELIRWGQQFFYIQGTVLKNNIEYNLSVGYTRAGRKVAKVNGNQRKKLSDFIGILNTVIFSPEDLDIVKSNPARRRKYLDGEMIQLFPSYLHLIWQYQKIIFQRNNLLKEINGRKNKESLLAIWDEQLVDIGSKIIKKRMEVLKKLSPLARLMHRKITGGAEDLEIVYVGLEKDDVLKSADLNCLKDLFFEKLEKVRKEEISRGVTIVGPHRDDFKLIINNNDVKKYGSQGQQRTTALSLKMAELELMKSETSEYPVLLLDDVMSELDESRREHLLQIIGNKVQTFITATDADYNFSGNQQKIKISQGKILNISR